MVSGYLPATPKGALWPQADYPRINILKHRISIKGHTTWLVHSLKKQITGIFHINLPWNLFLIDQRQILSDNNLAELIDYTLDDANVSSLTHWRPSKMTDNLQAIISCEENAYILFIFRWILLYGNWLIIRTDSCNSFSDSKVQGANMGPTWDLSAPDGSHVGPIRNLAIRVGTYDATSRYLNKWWPSSMTAPPDINGLLWSSMFNVFSRW